MLAPYGVAVHWRTPMPQCPWLRAFCTKSPTAPYPLQCCTELKDTCCPMPSSVRQCTRGIPLPTAHRPYMPLQCGSILLSAHCSLPIVRRCTIGVRLHNAPAVRRWPKGCPLAAAPYIEAH